ncbi:MAG: tetratricopeptide repeat protein [Chloroherpetonaceae bacterium]
MIANQIMASTTKSDIFTELFFQVTDFFEKNRTAVLSALGATLLAIAGAFFWNQQQDAKNQEATGKLESIIKRYEAGNYSGAIEGDSTAMGLKEIAKVYSGTPSGEQAKLYLANAYFQLRNYDEAQKTFESISSASPLVKASALAGEAACYEQKKEYKKAAQLFRRAAEIVGNDAIVPIYLENAGRNFELAGEKSDALAVYEKLKKEYPQSAAARSAEQIIARLKK